MTANNCEGSSYGSTPFPWKTAVVLMLVHLSFWLNQLWIWGLLFLWWGLASIHNGQSIFIEVVDRRSYPVLFWALNLSWIGLGIYYCLTLFYPSLLEVS